MIVPPADHAAPRPDGGRATILIVDDDLPVQHLLQALLQDEGYTVLLAANGQAGLDRVHDGRPDLLLIDRMLPTMDGLTLARHLRADPRTVQIPLIIMSAGSRPNDDALFDAWVAKPFTIRPLLELIALQLGGER